MSLDTSGMLLEGIRVASGNNALTFPPNDLVVNESTFDGSQSLGRAEYMLFVGGQSIGSSGVEIADPNFVLFWSRNNASIIRFDYDMFSRRWNTLPGGPPLKIGTFGNSPRIAAPVPDQTVSLTESPYYIFIGIPRTAVFTVQTVESDADFSNPPSGTVQISISTGKLNFSSSDLTNSAYQNQPVYVSQQSFNSRSQSKGIFGQLPQSASESYLLYLNPIPGHGQIPRIRIGYQPYLKTIAYANESLLTTPPTGSVAWSEDTGRVLFATADISANLQSNVYYDGVVLGKLTYTRTFIANISGFTTFFPTSIASNPLFANSKIDTQRYVFFAEPTNRPRYYFTVVLGNSSTSSLNGPGQGQVLLDVATGKIYISHTDATNLTNSPFYFLDSVLQVERGVAIQLFRSGVNGGGVEQSPDFTEKYLVTNQVIQSGIMGSPFVTLPTVPLIDSNLAFNVQPNTSGGTFVGPLANNANPAIEAVGYILNLDSKQVNFSTRQTVTQTLAAPTSSIKLQQSAIFSAGVEVTRNSIALTPGVDFAFNANTGVLDFLKPIGEDDSKNILNISGTVTLPNIFTTANSTFNSANVGMFLLISQGPNVNLYQITQFISPHSIRVSPNFVASGSAQADVRATREIIADRFFTNFTPPLSNFTISKSTSINGTYTALSQSQFTVLINTGQVNLTTPADPGDVFRISYIWNQSNDNGVTVVPTPVTEFAAFKIRQETCTFIPNTETINFNPSGNTVQANQSITLYVNGVTQNSTSFNFIAPSTLIFNQVLSASDVVIVDYFIAQSPGGNTSFTLVNNPITIDYPQITAGSTSSTFNGNQTSLLQRGGAFLLNNVDIVMIGDVSYDATTKKTTVLFNFSPANYSNGPAGTAPTPMQVCAPIAGANASNYMVTETNPVNILPINTNVISINAQVNYPQNTIVLVNGEPYLVASSTYDSTTNVTSVTLADRALKNYIIPVIQHTIRPVFQPGKNFQTAQTATLSFPFTLVNSGTTPTVLVQGIDYTVSDGGAITLAKNAAYGTVLNVLYVARAPQPTGTVFTFNYAYAISPSSSNGLIGQNLAETYDLYSPDTFFFNVETIVSFIPIVIQTIQQNSSAGSGPNTKSQSSPQTKDQGTPSLYWLEYHLGNEDIVVGRLLKFYNDLINNYEDILSDLDGRVVGGNSGKFRYSGVSRVVTTYDQITNDIDDEIVLYFNTVLIDSSFTFESVPVYGFMYQPNNLSRIYPTADPFVTVALNDKNTPILDYGNTIGTTGIQNLTSVSNLTSSRASSPIISAFAYGSNATTAIISVNGDVANLIPAFASGQTVQIYNPDGSPNGSEGTVTSVVGPDNDGNFELGISGVSITMVGGGVVQDTSNSKDPRNHFYTPGRDFSVNNNDGTFNSNYLGLPSPPFPSVVHISGNELVDTSVTFVNSDTTPRRIPVLDGSTLSDNGRPAVPPLSRIGELGFSQSEFSALPYVGHATVSGTVMTSTGGSFPQPIIGGSGSSAKLVKLTGTAASITTFSSPSVTLTGLTGMSSNFVGASITLTGASTSTNNGTFVITKYVSSTSVEINNTAGVAPDSNNGSIGWTLVGGVVIQNLTSIQNSYVGSSIQISGASSSANNGVFIIVAVLSSTSVEIINSSASLPDTNNGSIGWSIASATTIVFINGPNAGLPHTAISATGTTITVSTAFPVIDLAGSDYYIVEPTGDLLKAIQGELNVLSKNAATPVTTIAAASNGLSLPQTTIYVDSVTGFSSPGSLTIGGSTVTYTGISGSFFTGCSGGSGTLTTGELVMASFAPALIPAVDSELKSINTAIQSYGQIQVSGSGTPTSNTVLRDIHANFSTTQPPIIGTSLLYIKSGANQGLYQIASVTNTTITIAPNAPYPIAFPSLTAASPYIIFQPWSFLSSQEFAFATSFLQGTLAYYNSTSAWNSAITAAGVAARKPVVTARQTAVKNFITTIEGLLNQNDNLYNTRYLWIQQRTDKTIGLLIQETQATAQRIVNTQNLIAAQQKLLIMNSLMKAVG